MKDAMRGSRKKLCQNEVIHISARCRERFLPLHAPELRLLADAGVMFAGASVLRPRYEIRRQNPRCHTLIWTAAGSGCLVTGGRRKRLGPGTLWIGPAGAPHHYWIDQAPWHLAWVCLAPENRCHFAPAEPRVAPSEAAAEIGHVIRRLASEAESRQPEHLLAMETYARLLHLLLKREILASHEPPLDLRQRALGQLFQQVRERPSEPWRLETLRRASGLPVGPQRFRQLCVGCLGKTPLHLVTDIRMEIARELLSATDYRIYTVGGLVGYQDEYAFTAAFHRETGLSPSRYRATCRS